MMMCEFYIWLLASFQILTFSQCESSCETGFYGTHCNLSCSPNCQGRMCIGDSGIGKCTYGCTPGFFGNQCGNPCQTPEKTCEKCPGECKDGFCYLEGKCYECVNGYYGNNCTCDITKECHPGCGENCLETSSFKVYYFMAGGVGVFVLVSILCLVIYLSHRMKRVDAVLNQRVGWTRGDEVVASGPEVSVSTPSNASLTDSLYTAVKKEPTREIIPVRSRSEMEDFMDACDAVTEFDEVGTYDRLKWSVYRK